jgi:hypothetical protein
MAADLPIDEQIYLIVSRTSDDTPFARTLPDDERVYRVSRILVDQEVEMLRHRQLIQAGLAGVMGKRR